MLAYFLLMFLFRGMPFIDLAYLRKHLGSQVDPPVPEEPLPVPATQEADPQVAVSAPGQTVSSAPRAPEAGRVPKPAAGQTLVVPAGTKAPLRV